MIAMDAIVDMTNPRGVGTFKFQYSRHAQVDRTRFIPGGKKLAEPMLTWFFTQTLKGNFQRRITATKACEDDSNKNPDVLIQEEGVWRGVQITQLTFTRYETRKEISVRQNQSIADQIATSIKLPFPVVINIFPTAQKGEIPLENAGKKGKILNELIDLIVQKIAENLPALKSAQSPIWLNVDPPKLAAHFHHIVLNRIPSNTFFRFPFNGNISINYDQDDIAFNDNDIAISIDEVFQRKNLGNAQILLVWSDQFGLNFHERKIAESLLQKFATSSFEEVYFMTFENHISRIKESLNLWPVKTTKQYIKVPVH